MPPHLGLEGKAQMPLDCQARSTILHSMKKIRVKATPGKTYVLLDAYSTERKPVAEFSVEDFSISPGRAAFTLYVNGQMVDGIHGKAIPFTAQDSWITLATPITINTGAGPSLFRPDFILKIPNNWVLERHE